MKLARPVVAGVATALALGVPGAASSAAVAPTKTYEISFDGFCDGLSLNMPSAGLGTTATVDGSQIGCDSGAIYGQTEGKAKKGPTKATEYVTYVNYSIFAEIDKDGTFTYYVEDPAGTLSEILTGTWSPGPPALAPAGAVSSVSAAANLSDRTSAVEPEGSLDLIFDGYCDGMHLDSPSLGTGEKGSVDGHGTGCAAQGLIGAKGKIGGAKNTYAVQWTGGTLQSAIFKDHTWIHYASDGASIFVLNSGTWTEGIPPAPGQADRALPSSAGALS